MQDEGKPKDSDLQNHKVLRAKRRTLAEMVRVAPLQQPEAVQSNQTLDVEMMSSVLQAKKRSLFEVSSQMQVEESKSSDEDDMKIDSFKLKRRRQLFAN